MAHTAIIILAAGASSRMGQSKQLLPLEEQTLLSRTISVALKSDCKGIVVVLGSDEAVHKKAISNFSVDIVHNPQWESGIGSSLKCGLLHLLNKEEGFDAVIILACDQPHLNHYHVNNLETQHRKTGKPIVASAYAGTAGIPVFFSQKYFERLLAMKDSFGAKKIISQNEVDVALIDFEGGEIDLDTIEDYTQFIKSFNK